MNQLQGKKVAILVEDGFEQVELLRAPARHPQDRFRQTP